MSRFPRDCQTFYHFLNYSGNLFIMVARMLLLTNTITVSIPHLGKILILGGRTVTNIPFLSQITPENVYPTLRSIAWTYSAPDSGQMQMNPIVVDSILYGVRSITGRWPWTPELEIENLQFRRFINRRNHSRGVSVFGKKNMKMNVFLLPQGPIFLL